jgi:hypothetical protein
MARMRLVVVVTGEEWWLYKKMGFAHCHPVHFVWLMNV